MKSLLNPALAAAAVLALFACNGPDKQVVENIEAGSAKMESFRPTLDSLDQTAKRVAGRMAERAPSMQPDARMGADPQAEMAAALTNKMAAFREEYQKSLDEYNALLKEYKAGNVEKTEAEAKLKELESRLTGIPRSMERIKDVLARLEQGMTAEQALQSASEAKPAEQK